VAVRVAAVGPLVRDVYVRDGIDDDGTIGSAAFGGRSPDIIVVQAVQPDPRTSFRDLLDQRAGDFVRGSEDNVVYVRVFNRKTEPVTVDVELWRVEATTPLVAGDPDAPPFDSARWTQVAAGPPAGGDVASPVIPPRDWGLARFTLSGVPDPESDAAAAAPYRAIVLVALVRSQPAADDPLPVRTRVTTPETLWSFFRTLKDSNNAAMRAIRYVP
jgi:hypothetical protein